MGNVDQFVSGGFIKEILNNIETHPVLCDYDSHKVILWDNLHTHKNPFVTHIIEDRETVNIIDLVDRPPYIPNLAPIEFLFVS